MRISDWSSDVCSSDLRVPMMAAPVPVDKAVMALTQIQRHQLRTLGRIVAVSATGGAVYGGLLTVTLGTTPVPVAELALGLLRGLFTGALVSAMLGGFEMFVVAALRTQFRRLRFLQLNAVKGLLYTVINLARDWPGDRLFQHR